MEEEAFFNHYKNDLNWHAHTLSGDVGVFGVGVSQLMFG